jgi:hypothetical protein
MLRRKRPHRATRRKPLKQRRDERELFFWTLRELLAIGRQAIRLLLLLAVAIYLIVSLIEGRLPGIESVVQALGSD